MEMSLRGLDKWITEGPRLDEPPECRDCGVSFLVYDNVPDDLICDECRVSECDCCGEMKAGCVDTTYLGMDVHACPKCRDAEEDAAADRGDWRFHQDHDQ